MGQMRKKKLMYLPTWRGRPGIFNGDFIELAIAWPARAYSQERTVKKMVEQSRLYDDGKDSDYDYIEIIV